jgi:hypothetical protein
VKVGIIANGSGPLYTDAALALGQLFDNCVIVGQEIVSHALHDCDMFIVIGNYFRNYQVNRAGPAKKYVYASGKPFIVVTGSLFNVKKPDHVRLNVNGFCNNFAMMPPSDPDRLVKLLSRYNISNIGKHIRGDKIVIAPNALASPMMFGKDVNKWIYFVLDRLDDITDRPIEVRYHRKNIIEPSDWFTRVKRRFGDQIDICVDTKDDLGPLEDAYSVITYNSTYSVLSLLTGSSNIALHPGSFVYELTKNEISVEGLTHYEGYDKILSHYGKLANMEWSLDEIRDGSAWKVIEPMVEANEQKNRQWL